MGPLGSNAWDAARDVRLQRYCELLARGLSQLSSQPAEARARAEQADRELPGRAAPWVLRARASMILHQPAQAASEFSRARALDPRSVDDPQTTRALARALWATGQISEALLAYRTLVPQLSAFASDERAEALLEAAEVAQQVGPAVSSEAVAWLREAHRSAPRGLTRRVAAVLALALDRAGAHDEAVAVSSELARRRGKTGELDPTALRPEQVAALAFAAEQVDLRAARAGWQRYLALVPADAPFRSHAEARLAALRRGSP
jgi:tetratricopeptide (TPR) repeat protein